MTYGLYVVTSCAEGKRNGQIANTVFQVTAEPPRLAVSLNRENLTHEYVAHSGVFGVSVLEEETPRSFIRRFGFASGRDVDKFASVAFKEGATGCPLVTQHALAVMEAKVVGRLDVGTHTVFIGEVVGGDVLKEGKPLTYACYYENKKGRAPATAPTYRGASRTAETERSDSGMRKYVCGVCGYVYDPAVGDPDNGVDPGTPWEEVPDDWTCPLCDVGKDQFEAEA